MAGDWELLERYAAMKDPAAFAELVRRHVDVVYAAAARMLAGPGRGEEDVVQAVFLLLSQKAGRIPRRGALVGWLFRATVYCCKNVKKGESLRRRHEREAAMEQIIRGDHISPGIAIPGLEGEERAKLRRVLDEGLARLGEKERQAILVRYLQGKTAAETGAVLGVSAEAVEKRLERGILKLRAAFARKGFAAPAAGLAGVMIAESAKAAPAGFGTSVAGATASASAVAVGIAKGAAAMMKAAKMKMMAAAICVLLVLGLAVGIIVKMAIGPVAVAALGDGGSPTPAPGPSPVAKGNETVDAPALVREVRQKEKWIETVQSFRVKATNTHTPSKQTVVNQHQRALEEAAKKNPDPHIQEQGPAQAGTLELAFDDHRAFYHYDFAGWDLDLTWDGKKGISRGKSSEGESYGIHNSVKFLQPIMEEFFWPLADPHPTWWAEQANREPVLILPQELMGPESGAQLRPDGRIEFPTTPPEDFVYLRTEQFQGIECYVVQKKVGAYRWSIGVKDHLLHRVERGGMWADAAKWKSYVILAEKQGVTITDDITKDQWLRSLPESKRDQIASEIQAAHDASGSGWLDFWLLDYVELKPGMWYPKTQKCLYRDTLRFDGKKWVEDYLHPFEMFRMEINVTDVKVGAALPDSMFTMDIKEGASVSNETADETLKEPVRYKYKKDMTAEEWAGIIQKAKEEQWKKEAENNAVK